MKNVGETQNKPSAPCIRPTTVLKIAGLAIGIILIVAALVSKGRVNVIATITMQGTGGLLCITSVAALIIPLYLEYRRDRAEWQKPTPISLVPFRHLEGAQTYFSSLANDSAKQEVLFGLAKEGRTESVKHFLDQEVSVVCTPEGKGITPLHVACHHVREGVIKEIVGRNNKLLLSLPTDRGDTPLHTLCGTQETNGKKSPLVDFLLQEGAACKAKNNLENTPLHELLLATEWSYKDTLDTLELLVQNGASLTEKNKQDQTPLDLAKKHPFYQQTTHRNRLNEIVKKFQS